MSKEQKSRLIQLLKNEGVFIRYCRKDGYVYEIIRTIQGQTTRYLIGLKNGDLRILHADTVRGLAA